MKKNFFKKLSFVLAFAMIVSVLAPAAGVFAKAAPKLNAKTAYLYLDVAKKNAFDFNVAKTQKGWKLKWSSANKKVATVNSKSGVVTAVGTGKTQVSVVIKDKDGEEVNELTATVYVRDNIKDLVITNKPANDKVAVGTEVDFNRTYTTVAGKTTKTSGITRWFVTDKDGKAASGATIVAENGKFVATTAGTYTITARAFQSKAKYTSWLADNAKYASYVTATATTTVTVATSMVSAKQTTLNKFDLVFDSAMVKADVEKNLLVSYMAGTTKIKQPVKSITMSTDNKTATVEMTVDFIKGSTYVADYTDMKAVQFVAATTNEKDVTEIAILTTTAEIGKSKTLDIAIYNKDKVNLAGDANLLSRVQVEKKDGTLQYSLDGKNLYMYKIGDTVTLKATYHTYAWADGKEVGNLEATQTVTCIDQIKNNVGQLNAYTVSTTVPTSFKDVKHTTFKGSSADLYVELKGVDASGKELITTNKPGNTAGKWKYVSSNKDIFSVDENNGKIFAIAEGSATVIVFLNDVQVASCEVQVTASQRVAKAVLDNNGSMTGSKAISETLTVGLSVEDQLNSKYSNYTAVIKPNNDTADSRALIGGSVVNYNANTDINIYPYNVAAGTYYFTITVTDGRDNNIKLPVQLMVTIQDPGANPVVSYYKVEPTKSIYDVKDDGTVKLAVYGYTAGGIKCTKLANPTADLNGLDIRTSDNKTANVTWNAGVGTINLRTAVTPYAVSGASLNVVEFQPTGFYTIKATSVSGQPTGSSIWQSTFEVKNTRNVATATRKASVAGDGKKSVLDVINDCYDFAVGDTTLKASYLGAASGTNYGVQYTAVNNDFYIDYVYIYEPEVVNNVATGNYFAHKVSLGNAMITQGK